MYDLNRRTVRAWDIHQTKATISPKNHWAINLPRDEDGVTRDADFYGCTFQPDVVGTFVSCTVDGIRIPDGTYNILGLLASGHRDGTDLGGRWGVHARVADSAGVKNTGTIADIIDGGYEP